ncbi:MAG: MvdC family ATP-grasp ribosomal peptide maturase [Planctomycetota bacterium]
MATRDTVLVLTHRDDFYTVDRVAQELVQRGARPIRVDGDRFPTEVRLSSREGVGGASRVLETADARATSDEIRAVWVRHLFPARYDGRAIDERFREGAMRESAAALEGFLGGMPDVRWIDRLDAGRSAAEKLRQLRIASEVGLTVPRTLVTNDPDALRTFAEEIGGDLVAKLLTRLSTGMEKQSFSVPTSLVSEADLVDAGSLSLCPMVFQELVPKAVELRIAYVGGRLFTGAIDASGSSTGRIDWREADPSEASWQEGDVPDEVANSLRALMQRLGLVYGAIDVIRTPEGEHVFLEVNPNGEWGMLEFVLGLPVAAALADELLREPGEA